MPDRRVRGLVKLCQREGRTRHVGAATARGDEGAGEGGLAGTQLAAQRDHVAGPGERRQAGGKRRGGGFIRQFDDGHGPRLVYRPGERPQYLLTPDAMGTRWRGGRFAYARRAAKLAACATPPTAATWRSSERDRSGFSPCSNAACSTWAAMCSTLCRRPAGNAPRSIRKSRSTTSPATRESMPPSW